jgi:hypothetical protein
MRVHPDGGVQHAGSGLSERHSACAFVDCRSSDDHLGNASGGCAGDHVVEIGREGIMCQVCTDIDEVHLTGSLRSGIWADYTEAFRGCRR